MQFFNKIIRQCIPFVIALLTCSSLNGILFLFLFLLNHLFPHNPVVLRLRISDILVGLTIYLKTAIDFAIFLGNLMYKHPGIKNRIAIELGTALGNGIGTIAILCIWIIFKSVPILLFTMILIASLVLLRMAEEGLTEYLAEHANSMLSLGKTWLSKINKVFSPLTKFIIPEVKQKQPKQQTWSSLFLFSCTIPFLLGLDDFAGYIPLFSLVNVFGFAIGVFLGHMILTASLFAQPNLTTRFVRTPVIMLLGSIVFVGLALWGCYEAVEILLHLLR